MNFKTNLFLLLCFLFAGNVLLAQPGTVGKDSEFTEKGGYTNFNSESWSFFVDEEAKIYYIDFEAINVNLSSVVLKNASGKVLMEENVVDLPVNTIYELDLSSYQPGTYEVELRSYTDTIRRKITVK
jgi:hypothetical protein